MQKLDKLKVHSVRLNSVLEREIKKYTSLTGISKSETIRNAVFYYLSHYYKQQRNKKGVW